MAYALAAWAAGIAWIDWRQRRVPNALLILVIVPALLSAVVAGHGLLQTSAIDSGWGFLIAVGVTLPGYAVGLLGAGDVKFASSLGLLLGPDATLQMLLCFALVLGSVAAVLWMCSRLSARTLTQRIPAAPAMAFAFGVQLWPQLAVTSI